MNECPGDAVTCDVRNSPDPESSCQVSHSSNTVPHFNCSRQFDMVLSTTALRQTEDICPVKFKTYNITTLTVHENYLDKPMDCDVSYCSPNDSSDVYLTQHFTVPQRQQVSHVQDINDTTTHHRLPTTTTTTSSRPIGKHLFCSYYAIDPYLACRSIHSRSTLNDLDRT